MFAPALFFLISFLLIMLAVYLWASRRNLIKNRALTPQEYLWKLKQISEKSEYELFYLAAEEKGWPDYQVERHFTRYLENQTLPNYVIEFLEDQNFITIIAIDNCQACRIFGREKFERLILSTLSQSDKISVILAGREKCLLPENCRQIYLRNIDPETYKKFIINIFNSIRNHIVKTHFTGF